MSYEFFDDFNRADGALGSNWITGGSSAISVVSNQARHQNSSPGVGNNVVVANAIQSQISGNFFVELLVVYFVESTQRIIAPGVEVVWDEGFNITIFSPNGVNDTGVPAVADRYLRLEFTDTQYRILRKTTDPQAQYVLLYSESRVPGSEFGQIGFGMTNNSNGVGAVGEGKGIIDNFRTGTLAGAAVAGDPTSSDTLGVGVSLGL